MCLISLFRKLTDQILRAMRKKTVRIPLLVLSQQNTKYKR